MLRNILTGAIAGAAGTVSLNMVTYADMLVRGRPSSNVPATLVDTLATSVGVQALSSESEDDKVPNRQEGAGALMGFVPGLGIGIAYAILRQFAPRLPVSVSGSGLGIAAMVASDVPIAALGVSDPRTWSKADWLSDIIPHLVYGLVTAATFESMRQR